MKTISTMMLLITLLILPSYAQRRRAAPKPSSDVPLEQLKSVVHSGFGSNVKVSSDGAFYLLGDFNGDGFSDIAVKVNVEEAGSDLKSHQVKFINIDNGAQIDPLSHEYHHCLGIAITHGTAEGWKVSNPTGKYMVYECFSSFRLFRKGQRIRHDSGSREPTPVRKGDSILLDLETGGAALVYIAALESDLGIESRFSNNDRITTACRRRAPSRPFIIHVQCAPQMPRVRRSVSGNWR